MTVLTTYLVEDSPVIQQSLIATLQELTPVAVVGVAADEQVALQWLSDPTHEANLVIVDIFLRSGSGLGVLRAARHNRPERHMVVLSNYATPDIRTTCLALGAQQVFDKSTEIDALILYCQTLAATGMSPALPA
ncbi:response regulator transcription factor [Rhodoferax sp.]|uniref:response regulator transcription factor n=1 Tax=Rhodoferax sp. TaxID=50421 RepID=UPI002ACD2A02|nr:response regulator [Rhodoferax sp.]MDZ7920534.1 response regulator [Rhodoferax sp.]